MTMGNNEFMFDLKEKIIRYRRYISYLFQFFFIERPRGLDFSMRSRDAGITYPTSSGYGRTPKKAVDNMLSKCEIEPSSSFIDIGSGKGGVICDASRFPFKQVTGIDYEEWLHNIAHKNIEILGLSSRVNSISIDALEYKGYADYSHIFMFRPFGSEMMIRLSNVLGDQLKERVQNNQTTYLIVYGGVVMTDLLANQFLNENFSIICDEICPFRLTNLRILKFPED